MEIVVLTTPHQKANEAINNRLSNIYFIENGLIIVEKISQKLSNVYLYIVLKYIIRKCGSTSCVGLTTLAR